jgi:hypothetical protein
MLYRNILLIIGSILVLSGIWLSLALISEKKTGLNEPVLSDIQEKSATLEQREASSASEAVLEAAHFIAAGTLLRSGDVRWREIRPGEAQPGELPRSQSTGRGFCYNKAGFFARRSPSGR